MAANPWGRARAPTVFTNAENVAAHEADARWDEWIPKKDKATGKTYFYNPARKQSVWKNPSAASSTAGTDSARARKQSSSSTTAAPWGRKRIGTTFTAQASVPARAPSPEAVNEWIPKVDPSTGKTYFYNPSRKQSVWKKPVTGNHHTSEETNSDSTAVPNPSDIMKNQRAIRAVDPATGKEFTVVREMSPPPKSKSLKTKTMISDCVFFFCQNQTDGQHRPG